MNLVNDLNEAVSVFDWPPSFSLKIQEKLSRGQVMLDLRNWVKWNTDQQFHPGRNGLMVEKSVFIEIVLPKLNELYGPKTINKDSK